MQTTTHFKPTESLPDFLIKKGDKVRIKATGVEAEVLFCFIGKNGCSFILYDGENIVSEVRCSRKKPYIEHGIDQIEKIK